MIRLMLHGLLACAAITLSILSPAHAQPFPNKPITIIVPFGAGGPTDIVARVIGDEARTQGAFVPGRYGRD